MDVFLFKLKDNNNENVDLVKSYLSKFQGPLKFKFDNAYIIEDENLHKKNEGATLNWGELFFICNEYRQKNKINKNSFVIFLTKFDNQLNWFSAFDNKKNIFIQITHWELYTDLQDYYPIIYQIVQSVLVYFMKIDLNKIDWDIVHENPIGCINDFCGDKKQIIIKIQNANICKNCLIILKKNKVNNNIIEQSLNIFDALRNDIINNDRKIIRNKQNKKYNIIINTEFQIIIKELKIEIKMFPALKMLYLLFLKIEKGICIKNKRKNTLLLSDCKELLIEFYTKIPPLRNIENIENTIKNLIHPKGKYFNETISKINSKIIEILDKDIATHFIISGDKKTPYSVKIPKKNIHFKTK